MYNKERKGKESKGKERKYIKKINFLILVAAHVHTRVRDFSKKKGFAVMEKPVSWLETFAFLTLIDGNLAVVAVDNLELDY